jgi:DNA-binding CsgD family transcriptional regulator
LQGKSGTEVAGELGLNVNAVYTNAHRVMEKIRMMCLEHDEELNATSGV